jgi:UDP-N-acetylmuramate-alanine ligase
MNNFFKKIIFAFKKTPIVFIFGSQRNFITKTVSHIAKDKNIKLYFADLINYKLKDLKFLIKNSSLPIIIVSNNGEEKTGYQADLEKLIEIVKIFPKTGFIVADYDLLLLRKIKNEANCYILTYGLNPEANLFVTDINFGDEATNFKINYEGKTIPLWIEKKLTEAEIKTFLAAIYALLLNKINLVEISQLLRNYSF